MTSWSDRIAMAAASLPRGPFCSPWRTVTQAALDAYAQAVDDPDPMHVDPAWSRERTPYGGTVAPGLWTAAMFVRMVHETGLTAQVQEALGVDWGLNYGFDRLRFVRPLPTGSRIRGRFEARSLVPQRADQAILTLDAAVEREGSDVPVVTGQWKLAFMAPRVT